MVHVPDWVDRRAYPFQPQEFRVPAGRLRYVDERPDTSDRTPAIVMVHGNPYWSFEYRALIRRFSSSHRCIAPDHLGFGLSDKPVDWDYLPEQHAGNLELLLDALDVRNMVMVVNDWGGPIGLSYAINHPERVAGVVVTNSWLWPVDDDWYYRTFSTLVGGWFGRSLIRRRNFFARTIVRAVYGDKQRLTPELHRQICAPLSVPDERKGSWVFPREIVGSTPWLRDLWSRREVLRDKVRLLVWGMKDIAFRERELTRWCSAFPEAQVVRLPETGHFVADESPDELIAAMSALF